MASRHADRSRVDQGRYEPPPRRDEHRHARDRDRDDRYDDRYDARDRKYRRDDRDRGSRKYDRRSRSPAPRDRSRDRRDRGGDRGDRRMKDYGRDGRSYRRRSDSRDSRRSEDRRRRSPESEARDKAAREQKEKEELERKEAEDKEAKLQKLEAWKKKQLEKKRPVHQADSAVPPAEPALKRPKPDQELVVEPEAAAKPLPVQTKEQNAKMSSFGLKVRGQAMLKQFGAQDRNKGLLLDEGDASKDRKLKVLSDTPQMNIPDSTEERKVSGMDVDEVQHPDAATLKDSKPEDAPVEMKLDNDVDAEMAEDDFDPLDAFMADLKPEAITNAPRQGQIMLADDDETPMQAIADDNILAITAANKKKKKEAPIPDQSKIHYEPFRRSFYTEPADIAALTDEQVADIRLDLDGIKVKGANVPRPALSFPSMGLNAATLDVFNNLGYKTPTPIQAQAIPALLSGNDVIASAKTGSGKTLAFGIPLIRHILAQEPLKKNEGGPIAIILSPTRELTMQIVNELKPFMRASSLKIVGVYGGTPISDNIALIKKGGIHVLVATAGRLIDLLQVNGGRLMSMRRVTFCCLDEADRMLDMGFEPQVTRILSYCRPDLQIAVFSATFPDKMEQLARKLLQNNRSQIIVGGKSTVAPDVDLITRIVPPKEKFFELLRVLGKHLVDDDSAEALIFVETQNTAEDLLSKLMASGYPCAVLHGNIALVDRQQAIDDFKHGVVPILIATGVAARGLDIKGLKLVVLFDAASHLEEFVHRVGRTGRAGNTGTAVTLLATDQERLSHHVVKALKQSGREVPDDLNAMAQTFYQKLKDGEEKWYDTGFGGKGLDRLDAARALEKKREKLAHRVEGEADDIEEEGAPSNVPIVKKTGESAGPSTPIAATPAPVADEPSYMRILREGVIVNKTERPAPEQKSSKPLSIMEQVRLAAGGVDNRLSKKGTIHAGQPIDNKGPDAGLYHSTIEINDFPQKARWGVTNRTNVARILDATGTSITTKGRFYPPGKTPGEGEEAKLYILVEGDTENQVSSAMSELQRLLREGTVADAEAPSRGTTGRYNVLS